VETRYRKLAVSYVKAVPVQPSAGAEVSSDLERLGMAGGVSVRFEHLDHFSATGTERMSFVSTNPGQP
jgi:hypothetical protein